MNASIISALSALAGAAIGGLTSVVMSWLTQVIQARAQQSAHDKSLREDLYKEFIDEASKSYIDALQNNNADISSLVGLYARSAGCGSCPRQRSLNAPIKSPERLSTPTWRRT